MKLKLAACRIPQALGAIVAVLVLAALESARGDSTLLVGATVHTVSGETLSPGTVLIQDGRIVAVSREATAKADQVVDLKGLHLYPGIIAMPSTLGLVEISAVRATQDTVESGAYTPDVKAWLAVNPDSELLPVARANGITHFLATPMGGIVTGQSGLMKMTGWGTEAMTIKPSVALHVFWPDMGIKVSAPGSRRGAGGAKPDSPEDQAKERQRKLKELDDFFAEARAYDKSRQANPDTLLNPAWESIRPVFRGGLPLMIHADELRQIKAAVKWAATNQFKIILSGGRDAWRVAELLATNQVPVVFDATFDLPNHDSDNYDAFFAAPTVLHQAGVKVIFSEGMGEMAASQSRNIPYRAAQSVAFGLAEDEAIKGITLYPAEVLGVAGRLGSIEVGKEASLIAVNGSILDIRANVQRMWIEGKEVSLESRHTRLYEKYRNRPHQP
jgi:imidazolonepropionase-like amidohydrolase